MIPSIASSSASRLRVGDRVYVQGNDGLWSAHPLRVVVGPRELRVEQGVIEVIDVQDGRFPVPVARTRRAP